MCYLNKQMCLDSDNQTLFVMRTYFLSSVKCFAANAQDFTSFNLTLLQVSI